ncbi:hypothetical protein EV368DRAFT_89194 [Lentinula lateritia]|nr:hypothetical protein EV368DRAFT_89194 [Lentinula lateritia]
MVNKKKKKVRDNTPESEEEDQTMTRRTKRKKAVEEEEEVQPKQKKSRTKQTAKKSMGGLAPLKSIACMDTDTPLNSGSPSPAHHNAQSQSLSLTPCNTETTTPAIRRTLRAVTQVRSYYQGQYDELYDDENSMPGNSDLGIHGRDDASSNVHHDASAHKYDNVPTISWPMLRTTCDSSHISMCGLSPDHDTRRFSGWGYGGVHVGNYDGYSTLDGVDFSSNGYSGLSAHDHDYNGNGFSGYSYNFSGRGRGNVFSQGRGRGESFGQGRGHSEFFTRSHSEFSTCSRGEFSPRGRGGFSMRGRGEFSTRSQGEFSGHSHSEFSDRGRGSGHNKFSSYVHGELFSRGQSEFSDHSRGGFAGHGCSCGQSESSAQGRSGFSAHGEFSSQGHGRISGNGCGKISGLSRDGSSGHGRGAITTSNPGASHSGSSIVRNPDYVMISCQDVFCAGCHDGEDLLHCDGPSLYEKLPLCGWHICHGPPRSKKCLELMAAASNEVLNDPKNAFICSACWSLHSRQHLANMGWDLPYLQNAIVMQKDLSPLPNMLHAVNSLRRSFFNPLDLPPLAIISLSLKGMAIVPYSTALLQLQGFYSATDVPLISRSLKFDLGNTSNYEKYLAAIKRLLLDIKTSRVQHVIVFFTTHSTPDAHLHFSPGGEVNGACNETGEVLAGIFTKKFQKVLSSIDSSCFILACGGAYMFEKSSNSIGDFAKRFMIFIYLLLFKDFQPETASGWCTLFIQRTLIQRESIEQVLTGAGADSTILGFHSHVLVWAYLPSRPSSVDEIQTLTILKALWCHDVEAPFGIRITEAMCPTCGVLRK